MRNIFENDYAEPEIDDGFALAVDDAVQQEQYLDLWVELEETETFEPMTPMQLRALLGGIR